MAKNWGYAATKAKDCSEAQEAEFDLKKPCRGQRGLQGACSDSESQ